MRFSALPLLLIGIVFTHSGCGIFKEPSFLEMRNLKMDKLGVASSTVRMDLVYDNPNPISFQILSSEFDLYVDEVFLGHATSDSLIQAKRKTSFTLPVKLEADMKNLFRNSWSMLMNKTVLVKAKGTITVKAAGIKKLLPLEYEGRHEMKLF